MSSSATSGTGGTVPTTGSWLENRFPSEIVRTIHRLKQSGVGRWNNVSYADHEISLRVPQLSSLMTALFPMLPQLQSQRSRILDVYSISAQVAQKIANTAGVSTLTLLTNQSKSDFSAAAGFQVTSLPATTDSQQLPATDNGGYDLVLSFLGLQEWLEACTFVDSPSFHRLLQSWFDRIFASLFHGGHLFLASSDDARVSLFEQLQMAHKAGFTDIDVVYKQEGFYVFGARKVNGSQVDCGSQRNSTISSNATAPLKKNTSAVNTVSNAPTSNSIAPSSSVGPSPNSACQSNFPATTSDVHQSIHSPPVAELNVLTQHAQVADLTSTTSSSSSFARELPPSLLAKVPLLFRRFDPANSGRLAYSQLEALCRAVGRKIVDSEDEDGDGESLWWVYQSVASEDRETGCTGISIEDLINHFYIPHLWDLQHDLTKLRIV